MEHFSLVNGTRSHPASEMFTLVICKGLSNPSQVSYQLNNRECAAATQQQSDPRAASVCGCARADVVTSRSVDALCNLTLTGGEQS